MSPIIPAYWPDNKQLRSLAAPLPFLSSNCDFQFPMKQGVMHPTRVRLLLSKGHSCYRPRREGERKRKSVRGCIVAMDLSVLALSIVKKGEGDIPGLTDKVEAKRLGPKRATKIRRFFGLSKEDDVRFYIPLMPSPRTIMLCSLSKYHGFLEVSYVA